MEKQTDKQSLIKGAMILSIGIFISRIIGLLYRIPITNILGDDGNAIYGVAYTIYTSILALTAIAIPGALSKLVAEREAVGAHKDAHRVYKIALTYSVICALILATLMWIGADWISNTFFPALDAAMPIRALAPAVVIATAMAAIRGYFQGMNNMTPTAVSQIVEQIFNVIFSVMLAYAFVGISLTAGATGSTLGTGIGALAGLVVLIAMYHSKRRQRQKRIAQSKEYAYETTGSILKKILIMMVPMMITTSVFSVMTFIDQTMITNLLPHSIDYLKTNELMHFVPIQNAQNIETEGIVNQLLGQFSFQYTTFINIPVSLILQLGAAAVPAIAAAAAVGNYKDIRKKVKLIFKVGLLVAAPSSVAFILFGEPIMELLLKNPTGGKLLSAGAVGLIFITLAQLSAGILQGMGKPQIPTINAIIACCIKVIINLIGLSIPVLNIYGFIHSTTICYLVYAVLNIRYLRKITHIKLNWKRILIKPILSAGIMGIVSYGLYKLLLLVIPMQKLCMILIIPFAIVVYLLVGIATRTITKTDLMYIPGGNKLIDFLSQ